jgi:hypothetical protein
MWRHGKEVFEYMVNICLLYLDSINPYWNEKERVVIAISSAGVSTWKAVGGETHIYLGARVMAIRACY